MIELSAGNTVFKILTFSTFKINDHFIPEEHFP